MPQPLKTNTPAGMGSDNAAIRRFDAVPYQLARRQQLASSLGVPDSRGADRGSLVPKGLEAQCALLVEKLADVIVNEIHKVRANSFIRKPLYQLDLMTWHALQRLSCMKKLCTLSCCLLAVLVRGRWHTAPLAGGGTVHLFPISRGAPALGRGRLLDFFSQGIPVVETPPGQPTENRLPQAPLGLGREPTLDAASLKEKEDFAALALVKYYSRSDLDGPEGDVPRPGRQTVRLLGAPTTTRSRRRALCHRCWRDAHGRTPCTKICATCLHEAHFGRPCLQCRAKFSCVGNSCKSFCPRCRHAGTGRSHQDHGCAECAEGDDCFRDCLTHVAVQHAMSQVRPQHAADGAEGGGGEGSQPAAMEVADGAASNDSGIANEVESDPESELEGSSGGESGAE